MVSVKNAYTRALHVLNESHNIVRLALLAICNSSLEVSVWRVVHLVRQEMSSLVIASDVYKDVRNASLRTTQFACAVTLDCHSMKAVATWNARRTIRNQLMEPSVNRGSIHSIELGFRSLSASYHSYCSEPL